MNEHDDDLEPIVHEEAEEEVDSYPNTGDELENIEGEGEHDNEEPRLDDDEAEL
jgi:hypothetical protein